MHSKSYSIFFAAAVSTLPSLAHAEPVTFEELENHRVTASFVYARTIRRMEENRIVKNEQRSTITLTIRPENRIHQEAKVQVVTLNGREIGNFTGNLSAELNTPRQWRNGDMVFVFEQGNLIRLQTFDRVAERLPSHSRAALRVILALSMRPSPRKREPLELSAPPHG